MNNEFHTIVTKKTVFASAPCRVDLGGTVDIGVFYYPLSHVGPVTFNIALDMRTSVQISPNTPGFVKVSSTGFTPAEFHIDEMPFDHPMGLVFAIAAYFRIDGIHIEIASSSPPKSALGGSSVAAVAVIAALNELMRLAGKNTLDLDAIPLLAHALEETVAGVPCGCQDQMAAAYGGVNAWYWKGRGRDRWFERKQVLSEKDYPWINERMLVAYCGAQHDSKEINGMWIKHFIDGTCRRQWTDIIHSTRAFIDAFAAGDVSSAVAWMNRETDIRREMTPNVLDDIGEKLVAAARQNDCGARFAGAGGGGCLWAFGEPGRLVAVKSAWESILDTRKDARLLNASVDMAGVSAF